MMHNNTQQTTVKHSKTSSHPSQEIGITKKLFQVFGFFNNLSFSAGKTGRVWWIILSIALLVMGGSLLWNTFEEAYIARESTNHWVVTDCRISVSTAKELYREHLAGRYGNTRRRYYYKPEVLCEYTVEDIGSSFDAPLTYSIPIKKEFYGRQTGKSQAEKWLLENYPKDRSVEIYYNPDNPQQAVLTTGNSFWLQTLFYNSLGIGITVLGIIMLIAFFVSKDSA